MRGGRVALVGAVVAVALSAMGCSNDDTGPVVASRPTTTDAVAAADLETPAPPLPAADITTALQAAVDAADLCALTAAMDLATPDPDDPSGVIAVYDQLARSTAAARKFLPPELRLDWETVVAGTDAAATAVAEADGDVADPDVEVALTSSAMISALETVERFQIKQCAAATGG